MKKWIAIIALAVMTLGSCALTSQERTDLLDSGLDVAVLGVEILHTVDVDLLSASDETIEIIGSVCALLETGSPLFVTAINIAVDRLNDDAVDPVTVEEFTNGLIKTCRLIEAVLATPTPDA